MPVAVQHNGTLDSRLRADLREIEARFNTELLSDLSCVNTLVEHIERYRGKMLRPTLVLVAAAAAGRRRASDAHRILATVFEMVHMATLVHDDILDDAEIRRRGATINHLRGNEAAVMLGDYLISHAYHLCSSIGDPAINRAVADATNTVCEGELLQLANRSNWDLDEPTYFEIIRRKTASLCGACCEVSAALSDADGQTRRVLSGYGEKLGVCFQIIDDILDLTGEAATVGKTLGRDVEKGKLTLPLIRYLATAAPADRRDMLDLLNAAQQAPPAAATVPPFPADRASGPRGGNGAANGHGPAGEPFTAVRERVLNSDAIDYAYAYAGRLVGSAKRRVREGLPPSEGRDTLLDMATSLLARRA